MSSGIYVIRNLVNDKLYVGKSVHIENSKPQKKDHPAKKRPGGLLLWSDNRFCFCIFEIKVLTIENNIPIIPLVSSNFPLI